MTSAFYLGTAQLFWARYFSQDKSFVSVASETVYHDRIMAAPRVLVVAGSDSGGGAGLEADQKVLAAHGCYAMTATTALTAQNTLGVQDVHITPPSFVAKQINSCLDDIKAEVVKIGRKVSTAYKVSHLTLGLRHAGVC
jgi:hypothetical protein